jgi:hypothetical protein
MNIWNRIKSAVVAYWDDITGPLYRVAQNADGTWRITDREGRTIESPLPTEARAKERADELERMDRWT